jgi:CRISPR-associated protein Csd2
MHNTESKKEYSLEKALKKLEKKELKDKVIDSDISFTALISVDHANPNGNPEDNLPRTDSDDFGIISDVCIKRKLRNRLCRMGESVFVQSDEYRSDGFKSLHERLSGNKNMQAAAKSKNPDDYKKAACKEWTDVRMFGAVLAYKGSDTVTCGIHGPVSIRIAKSCDPVTIEEMSITKSANGETMPDGKKSPDTMGGSKAYVKYGLYVVNGNISVQQAELTGMTYGDAEKLKYAIMTMFEGDASSARPAGSMEVTDLVWYEQGGKDDDHCKYSTAKLHRSVSAVAEKSSPSCYDDYEISINAPEGLELEVYKNAD